MVKDELVEEFRLKLHTVTLEKIRFYLSTMVAPTTLETFNVDTMIDGVTNNIVQTIRYFLLGREVSKTVVETITYPASPWQAFKKRYFPVFLKKRFPPKMVSRDVVINHYHVYPHFNVKTQGSHITFTSHGDE